MKKKTLALTFLALASGIGMISCGKTSNSGTSSSSSEISSSSSSSASVAGKISLSTKAPAEIEVNATINMEDYVTVTKVSDWTIEAVTENIQVDGHNIKGIDYGSFRVLIIAGTTKKAYTGTVVSKDKIAFNKVATSLTNNYTARALSISSSTSNSYDVPFGINFHGGDYFVTQDYSYSKTDGSIVLGTDYEGLLTAPDGGTYEFTMTGDTTGKNLTDFTVNPGKQRSLDNYYLGIDLDLKATDFEEVMDDEGNPSGSYKLINRDVDDYGTTLVEAIGRYTVSLNFSNYVTSYDAFYYVSYDSEEGEMKFELAGTYNNEEVLFGVCIVIADIGTTSIEAVDSWLKSPTYPDPYDISSLKNVLNDINTKKNYIATSKGYWYDMSTEAVATEEQAKTATTSALGGMFFTYDVTTYVTESSYYSVINEISDAEAYGSGTDGFYKGMCSGIAIKDGKELYSAYGSYDSEKDATTWGTTTKSTGIVGTDEDPITTFDTVYTLGTITDEILAGANWNGMSESTNEDYETTTTWSFDEQDDNGALLIASYYQIGCSIGATYLQNFVKSYPQYIYSSWTYVSDEEIVLMTYLPWGSIDDTGDTFYYINQTSFSSIGETAIPESANIDGLLPTDSNTSSSN